MPVPLPLRGEPLTAYLVDLAGLARGLFATLQPLASEEGEPIAVTAALVQWLVKLFVSHKPAFLAFCADGPVVDDDGLDPAAVRLLRYWRARLWADYKAARVPPGPEYDAQVERFIEILQAHRIPVFRGLGYEADDYFGALVPRLRRLGLRVVIVSKDQDLWQLVDEGVTAWDGRASEANGVADVVKHYGVPPAQLPDLLALAGDTGEAPGLPGIGFGIAAKLVARQIPKDRPAAPGEVLELVLQRWQWASDANGKPGKVACALRDGAAVARLSFRLVLLGEDVPLVLDLAELRTGWDASDAARIRQLGEEVSIAVMRHVDAMPKPPLPEELARRWMQGAGEER